MYANGYFERLSAASRPGFVRRAVAGAVGVALAWWVAGALPAFEGDHVSQGVCAIDVVSGGETPILVAPSPWLPIWPQGQAIPFPGSVVVCGPGIVSDRNLSPWPRAVTPP